MAIIMFAPSVTIYEKEIKIFTSQIKFHVLPLKLSLRSCRNKMRLAPFDWKCSILCWRNCSKFLLSSNTYLRKRGHTHKHPSHTARDVGHSKIPNLHCYADLPKESK